MPDAVVSQFISDNGLQDEAEATFTKVASSARQCSHELDGRLKGSIDLTAPLRNWCKPAETQELPGTLFAIMQHPSWKMFMTSAATPHIMIPQSMLARI